MTPRNKIEELVTRELEEMCAKYGADFASLPEAYAVTLEEAEESEEEIETIKDAMKYLWWAIRHNSERGRKKQLIESVNTHAIKCAQECIQVSACCQKALRSNVLGKKEIINKNGKIRGRKNED